MNGLVYMGLDFVFKMSVIWWAYSMWKAIYRLQQADIERRTKYLLSELDGLSKEFQPKLLSDMESSNLKNVKGEDKCH